MQSDILTFASNILVDDGRLCMWMPTANDEDVALAIPTHPAMQLVAVCVQEFNKWSRRLLTYRRIPDGEIDEGAVGEYLREMGKVEGEMGTTADELNGFRRKVCTISVVVAMHE